MQGTPNFNDINAMRNQGISDSKIIYNMRHSGISSSKAYDKMRQADLAKSGSDKVAEKLNGSSDTEEMKEKVVKADAAPPGAPNMPPPTGTPAGGAQTASIPPGAPAGAPSVPPSPGMPPPPAASPGMPAAPSTGMAGSSIEEIEEVVETIIDERWKEVTENIKKVIDWKNVMDQRFERMDQEVKDLKENFNELYKAIVGKIGDYDRNLLKVGAEMKAMEKVFSKVLPTFTENVNDLARVAEDIRAFAVNEKMTKPKQ
jgi:DNA repair exonuclease SbcCD ATPase subunit